MHHTQKQATILYGLPTGSYSEDREDHTVGEHETVCPTCNLVQPVIGACC